MSGLLPPVVARIVADASEFNGSLAKAGEEMGAFGREVDKVNLQMRQASLAAAEAADRASVAQVRAAESAVRATEAQDRAAQLAREAGLAQQQAGRAAEEAAVGLGSEAEAQRLLYDAQLKATAAARAQKDAQLLLARAATDATVAERSLERASIAQATASEASAVASKKSAESHGVAAVAADAGKKALLGTAAAAALIGLESLKMAGNFQQSTQVFTTAAQETAKGLEVVRQGIKNTAVETGTDWQTLTAGMYQIEKAGYQGADAVKIMNAAAKGAREEGASVASVTSAMTSVMQSYNIHADRSVQVMNALKTGAGQAKTTMEDFASSLATVIPIASANKVGVAEVFGALGTLTQHGTSAREATMELAATIRALAAPNRVATTELQNLGLSATDLSTHLGQRGITGTLQVLISHITSHMGPAGQVMIGAFNQSKSAGQDLKIMLESMPASLQQTAMAFQHGDISLGSFRKSIKAMPADQAAMATQFLALTMRADGFNNLLKAGDPASQTFTKALKDATNGSIGMSTVMQLTGSSMAGFEHRVKTTSSSLNNGAKDVEGWSTTAKNFNTMVGQAKQGVEMFAIAIGDKLMPAAEGMMRGFGKVIDFLEHHKGVIAFLAGVTATLLAPALWAATAATWGFTVALLANPLTWIAIGIGLVVAGLYELVTHWHQVWDAIKSATSTVVHAITDAWDWLKQKTSEVWDAIGSTLSGWWHSLSSTITGWVKDVTDPITKAWDWLSGETSRIWNGIKDFFATWWPLLVVVFAPEIALFIGLWNRFHKDITDTVTAVWNGIKDFLGRVWGGVKATAGIAWKGIHDEIVQPVETVWHWLEMAWGKVSDLTGQAFDFVKRIALNDWRLIHDYIVNPIEAVWAKVGELFTKIKNAIGSALSSAKDAAMGFARQFVDVGKAIVEGMANGIKNAAGAVVDAAKGLAHDALSAAKGLLGVHSPSTAFHEVGVNVGQGFANGLAAWTGPVAAASSSMANSALVAAMRSGAVTIPTFSLTAEMVRGASSVGAGVGGGASAAVPGLPSPRGQGTSGVNIASGAINLKLEIGSVDSHDRVREIETVVSKWGHGLLRELQAGRR